MIRARSPLRLFVSSALAAAALCQAPAFGAPRGLPYVGTIENVDAAGRKLTLLGPDGRKRTYEIPEDATVMAEFGAAPTLAVLAGAKGKPVAVMLRNAHAAQFVSLLNMPPDPLEHGWLREVLIDDMALSFESLSGSRINYSPSVNLGASAAEGEAAGSADWAWFEKRLGTPFEIKIVRVAGRPFLWSVSPWKPKEDEKPPSAGGEQKPR